MKPGELRIGNWINRNGTADKITGYDLWHSEQLNDACHLVEWNSLNPIPLTEEWLLRFGFERSSDMYEFYHIKILNEWTRIFYNTKHQVAELIISMHGVVIKHIKYVHQLQNLHFTLTGKELPIE